MESSDKRAQAPLKDIFDSIIIGGGPAGLTAAIYARRAMMNTLMVEKGLPGGQVLMTSRIENYPAFPEGISGMELMERIAQQAKGLKLRIDTAEVTGIRIPAAPSGPFTVMTDTRTEYRSCAVIVATGARWNTLDVPGEKEFAGRGVSYCATCDGPLFRGKSVVVVGGGDSALEEALFLTRFVKTLTIIHRRDRLRAAKILEERALADRKIQFCWNSVVERITGKDTVEGVIAKNVTTGERQTIAADGVFIFIGLTPNTEFVKGVVSTDERGYIVTDDAMKTSVDGIFACGDVRKKPLRQVTTAVGDGATAAISAEHYCDRIGGKEYI